MFLRLAAPTGAILLAMQAGNPAVGLWAAWATNRAESQAPCPDVGRNLVRNGSFEDPALHGIPYRIVATGQRIGPWSVGGSAVDHMAPRFWEAAHGKQSLDLNDCGPGSVSQRVATAPGESFQLCFGLAGNPDGPPSKKQLEVIWEGKVIEMVEFDAKSATRERMGWTYHRFVVRATSYDAMLSFRSLTPGCYGPVVDRVTLQRLPDPVARGRWAFPAVPAAEEQTRL